MIPKVTRVNLYINSGELSLLHVPSTFATVNTHANVFFVFLPGGISKEWRHIVSANCDFGGGGGILADSTNVYGPFGEHLGDRTNSSRVIMTPGVSAGMLAPSSFCWPKLGCESLLAETPKGSVCWEKVAPSRFRCDQAIAVNWGKQR